MFALLLIMLSEHYLCTRHPISSTSEHLKLGGGIWRMFINLCE